MPNGGGPYGKAICRVGVATRESHMRIAHDVRSRTLGRAPSMSTTAADTPAAHRAAPRSRPWHSRIDAAISAATRASHASGAAPRVAPARRPPTIERAAPRSRKASVAPGKRQHASNTPIAPTLSPPPAPLSQHACYTQPRTLIRRPRGSGAPPRACRLAAHSGNAHAHPLAPPLARTRRTRAGSRPPADRRTRTPRARAAPRARRGQQGPISWHVPRPASPA